MSSTLYSLSVDTADAAKLARFWADALGRRVAPGASAEFAAIDPAEGVPRLSFHQVPEPKSVKNRLHLDLVTTEFEAESKRLTALGATPLNDVDKGTVRWTTFADPEGNEFDLVAG
ncbi:VOC family protein [Streptomyces sp. NPDC055025]